MTKMVEFKNNCEAISLSKQGQKAVSALQKWEADIKMQYESEDPAKAKVKEIQMAEIELEKDSTGASLQEMLAQNQSAVYYKHGRLIDQVVDPDSY